MTHKAIGEVRELLPCPFCGGDAKLRRLVEAYPADGDHPAGEYDAWFYVNCDDCGIEVGDEYQSDVIEAWNHRSALDRSPTVVEEGCPPVVARPADLPMKDWRGWDLCAQAHVVAWREERRTSPSKPEQAPSPVASRLAAWFNALPDGGIGKEHFDALLAIVGAAPSPVPQAVAWCVDGRTRDGEPIMYLPFLTSREDAERYQKANPDIRLKPLFASPLSGGDTGKGKGGIRICPERDGPCPHGMSCPYTGDRWRCDIDASRAALRTLEGKRT